MMAYHAGITSYFGRELLVVWECACVTMFSQSNMKTFMYHGLSLSNRQNGWRKDTKHFKGY